MSDVANITVLRTRDNGAFAFTVEVKDTQGDRQYAVTLARSTYERLSDERYAPETCIEAVFRFLLDREAKEQILSRFDVDRVSDYFPEFERRLPEYFPQI